MNHAGVSEGDFANAAKSLLSGLSNSSVPQDTVHYWIYTSSEPTSSSPCLEDLLSFACQISKNYIWHNQGFRLLTKTLPYPHFFGSTLFDENLEDEWFIVFILVELSAKFKEIVIKVQDSDGELLLIEAADFLPNWLNPETAENRVFIHKGKVHIVPPFKKSKSTNVSLPKEVSDAGSGVELILQYPELTLASVQIQTAIAERLQTFADGAKSNWHRAKCLISPKVAMILKRKPHLVADATRAFYLRDAFDLKACREAKHFKLGENRKDLVLVSVRFSKHLFAMIRGQKVMPQKGSAWLEILKNLQTDEDRKHLDLGMKLTWGFEILCNRAETSKRLKKMVLSPGIEFADSDTRWQTFVASLKKNGYFRGQMEGSKLHSELTAQAKSFFETAVLTDESTEYNPGLEVLRLAERELNQSDLLELRQEERHLPPEDDDSWLLVTPSELDEIAQRSSGLTNGFEMDDDDADDEENGQPSSVDMVPPDGQQKKQKRLKSRDRARAKDIGQKVVDWVEKGSGLAAEGAEEPKIVTPKKSRAKEKLNTAERNTDPCARSMQKMIDLNLGASLDVQGESSEMDSYDEDELQIDLSEEAMKEMREFGTNLGQYMKAMDKELAGTSMGKSFKTRKPPPRAKSKSPAADSIDLEDDDFEPVNIDKNLVTNMLESYWSESQPGPASALLHTLKLRPPRERAELDSDDFEEEFAGQDDAN